MGKLLITVFLSLNAGADIQVSSGYEKMSREKTVFRVEFGTKTFSFHIHEQDGSRDLTDIEFLNRGSDSDVITEAEHLALEGYQFRISNENFDEMSRKLVELAVEMMPVNEPIPNHIEIPKQYGEIGASAWKEICIYRGKMHEGHYTVKKKLVDASAVVGERATDCAGRCGPGCKWLGQYTQQCFNHDLCTRKYNKWFGPCTDEFAIAIPGFLLATPCIFRRIPRRPSVNASHSEWSFYPELQ